VIVVVHAGGCGGRGWPCSFVCLACVFLVLVQQRLGVVVDLDLFAVVEVHKTRKGVVRLTRKSLVRLTRKGLVFDVLNSSLHLSFYALFVRKSIICLLLIEGVVGTWIGFRVDGQSIRLVKTLTILCGCLLSTLFYNLISRLYAGSLGCVID